MDDARTQTVLVIDDSEDIHHLVGARLSAERLELQHAYTGGDGMRMARESAPDLILLDLDMPDIDGLSLCRQFKEDDALKDVPVIFLTGIIDTAMKVQAFELGAVDYVTKPFDSVELKARVRSALRTKRYYDLLVSKAQIDALTGLWNRGYFNDQLAVEMSVLERHGHPVSLLMLDIDHFKPINDTYGHPFGDGVLQRIADVLHKASRDSDIVCSYGGEEFSILLRHTPSRGACVIAERMRGQVAALEFHAGRETVRATASFGVAGSDRFENFDELTGGALLEAADKALYAAKANGRDCVEWHGPGR